MTNFIILLFLDWRIGVIFFIPFVPVGIWYKRVYDNMLPKWDDWEGHKEKSMGMFTQSIVGISTVQSFVQEVQESLRFSKVRSHMHDTDIEISFEMQRHFFWLQMVLKTTFIVTMVVGIILFYQAELGLGLLVYMLMTGGASINDLHRLVSSYSRVLRNLVSVVRLKKMMDERVDVENAPHSMIPKTYAGDVKLSNVTFAYPSQDGKKLETALENVSLEIKQGNMYAFVGVSGSGKTTIIKLIARMYDPTSGKITLDGTDIRELDRDWYRSQFAVVHQDVDVFEGSIRHNVAYGHFDATDEEIQKAMIAAHLMERVKNSEAYTFISCFSKGLDTEIGERGITLSGGQKQRVGIARAYLALMKGKRILILDEATSSLDSVAERAIQDMVNKIRAEKNITIIAIAHRLSTVMRSDTIFVLSEGSVNGSGTHEALLNSNETYAELVASQNLDSTSSCDTCELVNN